MRLEQFQASNYEMEIKKKMIYLNAQQVLGPRQMGLKTPIRIFGFLNYVKFDDDEQMVQEPDIEEQEEEKETQEEAKIEECNICIEEEKAVIVAFGLISLKSQTLRDVVAVD